MGRIPKASISQKKRNSVLGSMCAGTVQLKTPPRMLDFFSRNVIINSITGNLPPVYKTSR